MMEQRNIWLWEEDYPSALTPEEMIEPMRVVEDFFNHYSLQQSKSYLWHWLPYQFTDHVKPDPAFRALLYRFGKQIDRLVDAAWVIGNQFESKTFHAANPFDKKMLSEWMNKDFLSFISLSQAKNPNQVIQLFFQRNSLSRWKLVVLSDWNEALLNSQFWMESNSNYFAEFFEFEYLSCLLEALFMLLYKTQSLNLTAHQEDVNWCFNKSCNETPYQWGKVYFIDHTAGDALQSLAYLCHCKRFYHEWDPATGYRLITDYGTVYRMMHTGHSLAFQESVHHTIRNQLTSLFKKWPVGKITRIVSNCILDSPSFRSIDKKRETNQKEIAQIEQIIHLVTQHYHNSKN